MSISLQDPGQIARKVYDDAEEAIKISIVNDNVGIGGSGGLESVELIRHVYSSVNVTTAAYAQLDASTADDINELDIFDSSGQTLVFAVGAAASEVNQFYIAPGGNGKIRLHIPAASRLSVKAISANATVGELVINAFK